MILPPDVTALLEQLAIKLGVVAERLWAVIVRQQYIEGGIALGIALLVLGGGYAVCKVVRYIHGLNAPKPPPQPDEDSYSATYSHRLDEYSRASNRMCATGFGITVALVLVIFGTYLTSEALAHILNPEFAALNYLLRMVGR